MSPASRFSGVTVVAAIAALFMVRGMVGGGTPAVQASIQPAKQPTTFWSRRTIFRPAGYWMRLRAGPRGPGTGPEQLHHQTEPARSSKVTSGIVVRAARSVSRSPMPASCAPARPSLAATIAPGKRAVAIPVSVDTARGFILPNDRVDVVFTRDVTNGGNQKDFRAETILRDVRVLAIDQTARTEKDQQSAVGKTATLELTPQETELISQAQPSGILSPRCARSATTASPRRRRVRRIGPVAVSVAVIRYGAVRGGGPEIAANGNAAPAGRPQ